MSAMTHDGDNDDDSEGSQVTRRRHTDDTTGAGGCEPLTAVSTGQRATDGLTDGVAN